MSDATAVQAMQRHLSECEVARRALVDRALKLETALRMALREIEDPLHIEFTRSEVLTAVRAALAEVSP